MSFKNIPFPSDLEYSSDIERIPLEFYLEVIPKSKVIYLKLGYFSSKAIQTLSYGFAQFIHNGGVIKIVTNHYLYEHDASLLEVELLHGAVEQRHKDLRTVLNIISREQSRRASDFKNTSRSNSMSNYQSNKPSGGSGRW